MNSSLKIIFHYPGPIYDQGNTGEKLRPKKLLDAFKSLDFEVTTIVGNRSERKLAVKSIEKHLSEYDFVYSETSSIPFPLSNRYRFPDVFSPDMRLYRLCHKHNLPLGVFYRDAYWMFESFSKEVGSFKHFLSIPFYRWEKHLIERLASVIFTPSASFSSRIFSKSDLNLIALPPGCDIDNSSHNIPFRKKKQLRLIYVGSTTPPIYDISNLITITDKLRDILHLTIVTRENEWQQNRHNYILSENIQVKHLSGQSLDVELNQSDLAAMLFVPSEYRQFCLPLKLFEAITHSLPIICSPGTAVAEFVEEHNIGWVVQPDKLKHFFSHLLSCPSEIVIKREKCHQIAQEQTWSERVKSIVVSLQNIR